VVFDAVLRLNCIGLLYCDFVCDFAESDNEDHMIDDANDDGNDDDDDMTTTTTMMMMMIR